MSDYLTSRYGSAKTLSASAAAAAAAAGLPTTAAAKPKRKVLVKRRADGTLVRVEPAAARGRLAVVDDSLAIPDVVPRDEDEEDAPVVVQPLSDDDEAAKNPRKRLSEAVRASGGGWQPVPTASAAMSGVDRFSDSEDEADRRSSPPPPRRQPKRAASPGDISPPRRGRAASPGDISPPRRGRAASPGDISPPRRGRATSPRDMSPPRRGRAASPGDMSPPRRGRAASPRDMSPPRRGRAASPTSASAGDISPPRRGRAPPAAGASSSSSAGSASAAPAASAPRMSSGVVAGLHMGSTVSAHSKRLRAEEEKRFAELDPSLLGKDAATEYRDRRGRKLSSLTELVANQEGRKVATVEDNMEWGKGMVQKQNAEDRRAEIAAAAAAPWARHADDEDLNRRQREKLHWDDPMAGLAAAKERKQRAKSGKKDKKKSKLGADGKVVRVRQWRCAAPFNRFGIQPGYRWDGIDRGNGFEAALVKKQNAHVARAEKAYAWSVADM